MIEIRHPRDFRETTDAFRLLSRLYRSRYGTTPKDLDADLLVAVNHGRGGRIVGTVGLAARAEDSTLEVEHVFDEPLSDFGCDADLNVAEVRRFCCAEPGVGALLFSAAVIHAAERGVDRLVSVNPGGISRVLREQYGFGVEEFRPRVKVTAFTSAHSSYFFSEKDPIVVLSQSVDQLLPVAIEWIESSGGSDDRLRALAG